MGSTATGERGAGLLNEDYGERDFILFLEGPRGDEWVNGYAV